MTKMKFPAWPIIVLFLAAQLVFSGSRAGQEPPKKEVLSEASKQWLEEVVPYIITEAEKKVFLSLPNEIERGKFIAKFWEKRDPVPETPENEFKIAYYKRIALANKLFETSGLAGWRTDRGKILILLGTPSEVSRDFTPSTNALTVNASQETWNYWNLPNPQLPYNLEFVFVDQFGNGNFILETSVAGSEGGEVALDMSRISAQFDRMEILAEAMKNPFANTQQLKELITTQVNYDLIPMKYEAFCFKGTQASDFLPLIIEVPYAKLDAKEIENKYFYSLTLIAGLSDRQGRTLFQKSRDFLFNHSAQEMTRLVEKSYRIETALSSAPGDYRLDLLVLDNISGKVGTSHRDLSISDYSGAGLALSDIVLSQEDSAEETKSSGIPKGAPRQGQIRPAALDMSFRADGELGVYFEVYNLGVSPETGLTQFSAEFVFLRDGQAMARVPSPNSEPSTQKDKTLQTSLRLKNFKEGDIVLRINVTDETTKKTISKEIKFRVIGRTG